MKRFLPILLCLVLICVALSACGGRKDDTPKTTTEVFTLTEEQSGEAEDIFGEETTQEGTEPKTSENPEQGEPQTTEKKPVVTTTKLIEIGGITFEEDGNSGEEDLTSPTTTTKKPTSSTTKKATTTTTKKPTTTTTKNTATTTTKKPTTTTTKNPNVTTTTRKVVETPPVMLNPKK